MDRYTLGFLIFVGWFVCFRMFPAKIGQEQSQYFCGTTDQYSFAKGNEPPLEVGSDAYKGKIAFQGNCARCHNTALEKNSTGPALMGMSGRIPGGDWIYAWVHNSAKLIGSGDAYAVKIWKENNKAAMDPFPELPNETIDDIRAWIDSYGPVTYVAVE